jgi:hypothetical protein
MHVTCPRCGGSGKVWREDYQWPSWPYSPWRRQWYDPWYPYMWTSRTSTVDNNTVAWQKFKEMTQTHNKKEE